ncbi:MAG: copper ion binding protein [Pseudonocardiaceae bacterium]|nr:copper ion binding protein [Pseudonocardiaceae bacterium]
MAGTDTVFEYTVSGMSCRHCIDAVTDAVGRIDGVAGVDVDLDSGRVRVHSDRALDDAEVRAAIDEAGYEVVAG